ncbi:MAG: alpha-amylase family glycosyl hydrolase [Planctomycetota bacterium]
MQQLYELNVRTWTNERSTELGRTATLDDLPDSWLEHLAEHGFTWLYLLGVWPCGVLTRAVSLADVPLRQYLVSVLPGASDADVIGSPLAPSSSQCDAILGGDEALERLRERARSFGLSLMLDFIPNHVGLDHPWVIEHPELFVRGDEQVIARDPSAWVRLNGSIFAHGRDPFFAPWQNTVQFDYANPAVHDAVIAMAADVAARCDGLRCDVAMLLLPDVFQSTWQRPMRSFWKRCLDEVRALHPGTLFMAEVYWNREYELQQAGFDFTYDKILYDRLLSGDPESIKGHLRANLDYQMHCVRFMENHEEQRAAARFPNPSHHRGALFITGMVPGMLLCHYGQEDGRSLHSSLHARRRPPEAGSDAHRNAYRDLLLLLGEPARQDGTWSMVEARDCPSIIGLLWTLQSHHSLLVVINISWNPAVGNLNLGPLAQRDCQIQDVFKSIPPRLLDGTSLRERGLPIELPACGTAAYRILPQR